MDELGDGEGEPATVGAHSAAGEGEGADVEGFEGEDCGEGDADEPHADERNPERADGVTGPLHGADENHAVAEEDFGAGDIAQVVGGVGGDLGLVGEEGSGEFIGENKESDGDYGTDDGGLVGGHPTELFGAVWLFHAKGLTDESGCGDGEPEAGHEGKGFDAESGADGGDCGCTIGHPLEHGEKHEQGGDTDDRHEGGGGGDAGDALDPFRTGELDTPGFTKRGSGDENEVDDRRDPGGDNKRPGGSGKTQVCAGNSDSVDGSGGEYEEEVEPDMQENLHSGYDHGGFCVTDSAE